MPVLVLLFGLLFFVFPATAQTTKAENAIRCSALYFISSSTADGNKKVIDNFSNIQKMFERIYSTFERKRLDRSISHEMLSKKKSELVSRLIWKFESDPQSVYAIEMQCNAWRKEIASYISKKIGNNSDRDFNYSVFYSVPNMPDPPDANDQRWEKSKLMIDDSFSEWDRLGKISREAYRKTLNSKSNKANEEPFEASPSSQNALQDTSNEANSNKLLNIFGSSPITLQCFSIRDCENLDESMCGIVNSNFKGRTALATFNTHTNTIRWEEFYEAKDKSAFIKYWRIIINSENVIGAIEIPQDSSGFNSFLLEKRTMKVATNQLNFNEENRNIEHFKKLKRFQCKM
jgi:hypothetical protein